ncbi:hypothetical protein LEP1GSC036_0547 [Leptospira weilii str. 2006001853]|uniref:Uncharacterized protein n=2 Tax=Leptospira weilii TaxID=28184 RepID=A0A828Z8U4_9LEPT|nr:hypothetical protein LEP1GSC036_0547 [Leptospira weilii str. 2006001853]EMN43321.1 hypothetical protein LEP1GSC086_1013 [Leptospira weilii str. LNT 1234]QDK24694.1 hypothetical protein FHG67_04980 [Leptospira weilii]QDK28645.1 hypothetical protein FHG68_04895 [Leptospira weilii]
MVALILILVTTGCSARYYLSEFPITGSVHLERKAKIAYIGFRSFNTESSRSGRVTTYTAKLTYEERTIPRLENGVFIDELKSNGFRTDIPSNKVQAFAMEYLDVVKSSGALELSKLIDVEKENGGVSVFKLKNYPVDYFVVGVHGPAFAKPSGAGDIFLTAITGFFSMATFGLLPAYMSNQANTEIKIVDKNLNFVNRFAYDNTYTSLRTIWISPRPDHCILGKCLFLNTGSPPGFVYSGMGPKIEEDVLNSIQTGRTPVSASSN